MPLTNLQYDAIMRMYDTIRTDNRHIQNNRYEEVISTCPEYKNIEDEIISVSMNAASSLISGNAADYRQKLEVLNNRKKECLRSIGKPDDYLDNIYTCPKCKDTGYINQQRCSCFNKKAIELVYHDSNLKNITANENFDNFSYKWYDNTIPNPANGLTPYNNMQQVVSICHSFADNFDKEFSNLLLFGDTGVGKTFLSNCIAKELLDSAHSVIYLTAIELFKKFEEQDFGNKNNKEAGYDYILDCDLLAKELLDSAHSVIYLTAIELFKKFEEQDFGNKNNKEAGYDYILDCDLLIIDDLGTEVGNAYTNSKLFYCINERMLRKKSVLISTNLSLSEIRDTYSERVFSRITSCYKILKLFGADIRILKRTQT